VAADRRRIPCSFILARKAAGITGVTFHDLRGTAVTRLALGGATEPEIAAITGHSLKDVCAVPNAHYLLQTFSFKARGA
jgi:integrase